MNKKQLKEVVGKCNEFYDHYNFSEKEQEKMWALAGKVFKARNSKAKRSSPLDKICDICLEKKVSIDDGEILLKLLLMRMDTELKIN